MKKYVCSSSKGLQKKWKKTHLSLIEDIKHKLYCMCSE